MPAATLDHSADYDLAYAYDPGGNRTKKIEWLSSGDQTETTYVYDISDPVTFGSDNNRLMKEIVETVSGVVPQETRTPLRKKWYYYNDGGNVTRVVTQKANRAPGEPMYSASRMVYAFNQRTVTYAIGETWTWDDDPPLFMPRPLDSVGRPRRPPGSNGAR